MSAYDKSGLPSRHVTFGPEQYAQTVGSAEKGAVTHPGGAAETHCRADI